MEEEEEEETAEDTSVVHNKLSPEQWKSVFAILRRYLDERTLVALRRTCKLFHSVVPSSKLFPLSLRVINP